MKRRFATLDVFTERRFAGNPLAVVLQADGLDDAAMQTIAAEFNLSETVFVLPPATAAHRAALRIFTPMRELPFAGHPTVGTAVLLACLDGGNEARAMVLEERIGPASCQVAPAGDHGHASFALPALPTETGAPPPGDALAAGLGLAATDIGCGTFAPSCWSAGVPLVFVPLKNLDAVRRATPAASFAATFGQRASYIFSKETVEPDHDFHARMFAPHLGIAEDPATGSAAAAFAGMLVQRGIADGEHSMVIEQGYEMGRPSLMRLTLTVAAGKLVAASIGGGAVLVSEGTIEA